MRSQRQCDEGTDHRGRRVVQANAKRKTLTHICVELKHEYHPSEIWQVALEAEVAVLLASSDKHTEMRQHALRQAQILHPVSI